MKILNCPLNGPRNISEFTYGGEVHELVDPASLDSEAWTDQVFLADNVAGTVREWWCHTASAYWFIAERNTITDEIIRTYPADDVFHERR